MQRPDGNCAGIRIKRSRFEPWPGSLRCVLGKDTYFSLSTPRSINGWPSFSAKASRNTPCRFILRKPE